MLGRSTKIAERYRYCVLPAICVLSIVISSNAYALNLERVKVAFLNGDYKSAIVEGEKILANTGQSSGVDELYYILGLSYLKDGNLLRAEDIFEIVINEIKDSAFKDDAVFGLGDVYFLRGDFEAAQKYYMQLVKKDKKGKLAAQAYFRLSECALKEGDTAAAKEYLEKLKKDYPLAVQDKIDGIAVDKDFFYTVQAGSFRKKENAFNLNRRLVKRGYASFIEASEDNGKTVYRVRIGKFTSRAQAAALEDKLKEQGFQAKIFP